MHFTERFPAVSETFITDRVRWQAQAGHSVMVCAYTKKTFPKEWLSQAIWSRIPVIYWHTLPEADLLVRTYLLLKRVLFSLIARPMRMVGFALGLWRMKLGLRRFIGRLYVLMPLALFGADIIHVHFAHAALPILPYKHLLCKRLFVSLLGYDVTVIPQEEPQMYVQLFQEADQFLASSSFLVAKAKSLGCLDEKVIISYPGIDTGFFDPRHTMNSRRDSGESLKILTVARLHWEKGIQYSLEAIALVHRSMPDVRYIIVGDGEMKSELQSLCRSRGIARHVDLRGALAPSEVRKAAAEADIFLLSSLREAFGVVLAEAQAMGLPIVATRVGGVPEVVDDGVTGFLVPPRDPQALADKLLLLANNPDLRRQMGERGRERVKRLFESSQIMTELEHLYHESLCSE